MENSLKVILIAAGVVITMIVVTIGFVLMRSGQSTAQNAIGKLDQINMEMTESEFTMYDGMEVSGSEVVNVLKKYKDENFGVQVITKKNAGGAWYITTVSIVGNEGTLGSASGNHISDTINETDDQYIYPNGKFIGGVVRDKNGMIIALTFKQQ